MGSLKALAPPQHSDFGIITLEYPWQLKSRQHQHSSEGIQTAWDFLSCSWAFFQGQKA